MKISYKYIVSKKIVLLNRFYTVKIIIKAMKIKRIVFSALFLVSGLTIASAQVKLSFNPGKGKKYEYQTEVTLTNFLDQNVQMKTELNIKYLMEVFDKTPHEITVQYTYNELIYNVSSPLINVKYASKNPVENASDMDQMFHKMFSKIIDQSFTMIYAPNGSVKSITGMDVITEGMISAITDVNPKLAQIGGIMSHLFDENSIKEMFEQSVKFYPKDAVRVGDSWNIETSSVVNTLKTKYTLKSISKKIATIDVEGEAEYIINTKGSTSLTGTMIVNAKTGLLVMGDVKSTISTQLGKNTQMETITNTKTSIKEVKK